MLKNQLLQSTLSLLTAALNTNTNTNTSIDAADLTRWPEIEKELEEQAVLALVSNLIIMSDIRETQKCELTEKTALNVLGFHKLMKAQAKLLNLLESNNIQAAIIKGAAAAQYYPEPSLRRYGDVDVLVAPEDYRRTFDLLQASGYRNLQDFDAPYERHIAFETPDGIEIELHRYFSDNPKDNKNALLDRRLYDALRSLNKKDLQGYPISVLPELENGLVLLGHINHHLCGGLGLRHIVDWMLYVQHELDDEFWETQFKDSAEAIGMDCLAKTVTKMCQMYLGLTSEISWCADADETLAEALMLYIFKKGNFGRKLNNSSQDAHALRRFLSNPKSVFKHMTECGMIHMEDAGYKPRKAYAWVYQLGYLLSKAVKREHSSRLSEDINNWAGEATNTYILERLKEAEIYRK